MVVSFNTFNIIIFCCKDTSFIFVTHWLHMVADLSLSNQLLKIYTFTHSVIYLHIIYLLLTINIFVFCHVLCIIHLPPAASSAIGNAIKSFNSFLLIFHWGR